MKIVLINTFSGGGAAKACIRLHLGLLKNGVDSKLLLLHKKADEEIPAAEVFSKKRMAAQPLSFGERAMRKLFPQKNADAQRIKEEIKQQIPETIEWFSFPDSGYDLANHPFVIEADLINLHWVSDFLDYAFFQQVKKPIAWTMHDMNPFTGGCHYSGSCELYTEDCAVCPQLEQTSDPEYSHTIFRYKKKQLAGAQQLQIIALSQWLQDCSQRSTLFGDLPHHRIPNGLDSTIFHPADKWSARAALGLPVNKKIILFVAYGTLHTKRKGYAYLLEAFSKLNREDVVLCAVGGMEKTVVPNATVIDFGFVSDEEQLRQLYSAADCFVIPSLQDNLPNTVVEALLCGTPVAGFNAGGIPDMVKPGLNGMLASELSADALRDAINALLDTHGTFSTDAIRRDAVARFDQQVQANAYLSLFKKMIAAV